MTLTLETTDAPSYDNTMLPARALPATDREPRCWRCRAKLAEFVTRPWEFTCGRCKATNASPPAGP